MTATSSEFIGLHAFARDGTKLGKIKDVIESGGSSYLVIGRFLSRDLLVPADKAERAGERLTVPYAASFLDMAPSRSSKSGELTQEERSRLETFYQERRAA